MSYLGGGGGFNFYYGGMSPYGMQMPYINGMYMGGGYQGGGGYNAPMPQMNAIAQLFGPQQSFQNSMMSDMNFRITPQDFQPFQSWESAFDAFQSYLPPSFNLGPDVQQTFQASFQNDWCGLHIKGLASQVTQIMQSSFGIDNFGSLGAIQSNSLGSTFDVSQNVFSSALSNISQINADVSLMTSTIDQFFKNEYGV